MGGEPIQSSAGADNATLIEEPTIQIGGEPEPSVDDVQPVRLAPEPEPPKQKYLGEFDDETSARVELEKLRSFRDTISRDKEVQQLYQARQEYARQQEVARLQLQQDEQTLLKQYADAVMRGNPDEALLTLTRGVRDQAYRDARQAIRSELEAATAPIQAKQQLMESSQWTDLHEVADEAVWLATELGKLGYQKNQVADFMRRVGTKYASKNSPQIPKTQQRGGDWNLESPDGGSRNLDKISDKEWDKAVDKYWKSKGY